MTRLVRTTGVRVTIPVYLADDDYVSVFAEMEPAKQVEINDLLGTGRQPSCTVPSIASSADDHGDSRSDAAVIAVGVSKAGNIETSGDTDYFSFRAESGRSYRIQTQLGTLSDTVITLYDSGGSRLDRNDNISDDNRASRLEWTAPSSGTYYVRVEAYQSNTGTYGLSLDE